MLYVFPPSPPGPASQWNCYTRFVFQAGQIWKVLFSRPVFSFKVLCTAKSLALNLPVFRECTAGFTRLFLSQGLPGCYALEMHKLLSVWCTSNFTFCLKQQETSEMVCVPRLTYCSKLKTKSLSCLLSVQSKTFKNIYQSSGFSTKDREVSLRQPRPFHWTGWDL